MKTAYVNGKVYTGDGFSEAFLVVDEHFSCVGSDEEVMAAAKNTVMRSAENEADEKEAFACEVANVVDLGGAFVCAGFQDSHMHVVSYGSALNSVPLHLHTTALSDMLDAMKDFLAQTDSSTSRWLLGRGWNQDYFTDVHRMPTRADLDRISTEIPIAAVRCCGHCVVVNSAVLALAGITAETPAPEGGSIGMENGEPNGLFFDNAMPLVMDLIPVPDKETLKTYIRSACRALNAYGVTGSQSDDYSTFRAVPFEVVNEAFRELEAEEELSVRIYEQANFEEPGELRRFVESGLVTGVGTPFFKIGPLKMLGDGSLGARTAFLRAPYADAPDANAPDACGLPVFTQEEFDEMIGYAHRHNMQCAVHAIGDACLDRVLNAYEKAQKAYPRADHRHGIVHCQITGEDQLKRIASLGLHVYAQTIFLDYDIHIAEPRVGASRAATSYSWKTLMELGVHVSNGTDCPVELPDALRGMQCAVTRRTIAGDGPYLPAQAFTVKEALDSFTKESARACFDEDSRGRIADGYLADFVILGRDPFEVPAEEIHRIPVKATYVGGVCRYRSEGV